MLFYCEASETFLDDVTLSNFPPSWPLIDNDRIIPVLGELQIITYEARSNYACEMNI